MRTNIALKPYDMEELRRSILKQAESGVIIIPRYCEILHPNEMILEKIREEIEREMSVMPNEFNQLERRTCDNCNTEYRWSFYPHNFCPNCGARMVEPTCDTCEYNTAALMPCNECDDKSEYKPRESERINCKSTKCENCQNHNYCDFEPQESEE